MKKKKSKRGGSKPKLVCKNGHDILVVGRNSSGHCKQCHKEYYQRRWEYIKNNFKEQS